MTIINKDTTSYSYKIDLNQKQVQSFTYNTKEITKELFSIWKNGYNELKDYYILLETLFTLRNSFHGSYNHAESKILEEEWHEQLKLVADIETAYGELLHQILPIVFTEKQNDVVIGAVLANNLSESFQNNKEYLLFLLEQITRWERSQNSSTIIHKGSIFAFLSKIYFDNHNPSTGYDYLAMAWEEDKKNNVATSKDQPAYKTISLIPDDNVMFLNVFGPINTLQHYIHLYNMQFVTSFDFDDMKTKFLTRDSYDYIKLGFVSNLFRSLQFKNRNTYLTIPNPYDSIKFLEIIGLFGIILDDLLKKWRIIVDPTCTNLMIGENLEELGNRSPLYSNSIREQASRMRLAENIYNKNTLAFSITNFENNRINKQNCYASLLFAAKNLRNLCNHSLKEVNSLINEYRNIEKVMIFSILCIIFEIL